MISLTRRSIYTNIERTRELDISWEDVEKWENGMLIQDAMPNLSAAEREFVISGITPEEWKELFG